MDKEKVKKEIKEITNAFVDVLGPPDEMTSITLDGNFTIEQLEKIVELLKQYKGK